MNLIYETHERRSLRRRWGISLALAVGVAVAVVKSILAVTAGPRLDRSGYLHAVLLVIRWPLAALLLGFAVGLLAHYGAAERRQVRWTSAGSAVIVAAWMVESLLFSWYVGGTRSMLTPRRNASACNRASASLGRSTVMFMTQW
jgi:membrane protein